MCIQRKEKTSTFSIKSDDKVNAAVKIGFVDEDLGEEIKSFYKLRNAIHLETAVKKDIQYALDQSLLAYRRMEPFANGIRTFLAQNAEAVGHIEATHEVAEWSDYSAATEPEL